MANADVILENFRPGRADAWFAPWPERAVVCSITAYGNDGPRRDEGGYDLAMQARSGLMGITGDAEASLPRSAWRSSTSSLDCTPGRCSPPCSAENVRVWVRG